MIDDGQIRFLFRGNSSRRSRQRLQQSWSEVQRRLLGSWRRKKILFLFFFVSILLLTFVSSFLRTLALLILTSTAPAKHFH